MMITISNGISWALVISFEIGSAGKPLVFRTTAQHSLMNLLCGLSASVGFKMKSKVELIESLYSILGGESVRMHAYVEFKVLSGIIG